MLDYVIQRGWSRSSEFNLERIKLLKKALLHLVIKEFQKRLEAVDGSVYRKFIDEIVTLDCSIITTNYDIMLDEALAKKSRRNYGAKFRALIETRYENDPTYELDSDSGLKRAQKYLGEAPSKRHNVPLLKIHGSLNWLHCPKCDEVDVSAVGKGSVRTVAENYYCYNQFCTQRYDSLLITPTMYKDYNNRFIREVWEFAEDELISAEKLVFVGYALKDEDYQIRCLLMNAMLAKKKPYKNVLVVEKEPSPSDSAEESRLREIETKYRNLFGTIDFKPIGFQKYVESLSRT